MKKIKTKSTILFLIILIIAISFFVLGDNSRLKKYETDKISNIKLIKNNGQASKLEQTIISEGFKDDIKILLTIDINNDSIKKVNIVEEDESEGYGSYISKDWFQKRFSGITIDKKLEIVKMSAKEKNQIVAVTGATESSEAVVNAVNLGLDNYNKIKKEVILKNN